jgi:hypothetical protein
VGHYTLEVVFVYDGGNGFLALLVNAANDASGAVDQNVSIRAHHHGRKHNAKADDRCHGQFRIHVKENAPGGNVGSFSKILAGISGADCYGKLERKPYSTSEINHPITSRESYTSHWPAAKDYFGTRKKFIDLARNMRKKRNSRAC